MPSHDDPRVIIGPEEASAIEVMRLRTGVKLPSLAMIEAAEEGKVRDGMMEAAASLIDQTPASALRNVLYGAFRMSGASHYLDRLYRWHTEEVSRYGCQSLEQAIVNNTTAATAKSTDDHFLAITSKLSLDAIRYLLRRAKRQPELLTALRQSYARNEFDIDVIWVMANSFPAQYDALSGARDWTAGWPNRLTARQAASFVKLQEFPPRILPFYGTVVRWVATTQPEIADAADDVSRSHTTGWSRVLTADVASRLAHSGGAAPLLISGSLDQGGAVVFLTNIHEKLTLGLLIVPASACASIAAWESLVPSVGPAPDLFRAFKEARRPSTQPPRPPASRSPDRS